MASRVRVISVYAASLALVLAVITAGPAHGQAAAASGYHYAQLELAGDAALDGGSGLTSDLGGPTDETAGDDEIGVIPFRSGPTGGSRPPVPGGPSPVPQSRASSNPGLFGFAGLTHKDQRNAGTGSYANTQFSLEPPDQALCVGNGFVVESVNTAIAVYRPDGTLLAGPTALNQFFSLKPEINRTTGERGDFTSDPKCYYDTDTNRWFLTLLQEDPTPSVRTHIEIGVSKTGDPTGRWFHLRLDATDDGLNGTPAHATCPCFGDQPLIGADHFGFFISSNEFSNVTRHFSGVQLYAMSKWSLAKGILPTVVHIDDLDFGDATDVSVQPATTPSLRGEHGDDPGDADEEGNGGTEYFVSGQFAFLDQNAIGAWALTNTSSLVAPAPAVHLHHAFLPSQPYSLPVSIFQKNGPRPLGGAAPAPRINMNDFRMQQVVFAKGRLWTALTTRLQTSVAAEGGRKAGVAWFVVRPSFADGLFAARIRAQGYVSLANASLSYPAVGVNRRGQAVVGMSLIGLNDFPSAAYVELSEEHGAGPVHIAAAGTLPADGFTGYTGSSRQGIERWGDYGAAVADQNGDIWVASEYISSAPRTLLANWATFISRVTPPRNSGD